MKNIKYLTHLFFLCMSVFISLTACSSGGQLNVTTETTTSPLQTSVTTEITTLSATTDQTTTVTTPSQTTVIFLPIQTHGSPFELPTVTMWPDEPMSADEYVPLEPTVSYFANASCGYRVFFPKSWVGRYSLLVEGEGSEVVTIYCDAIKAYSGNPGWLAKITAIPLTNAPDLKELEIGQHFNFDTHIQYMLLGTNETYSICVTFPNDMQYGTDMSNWEEIGKEYQSMQLDIYRGSLQVETFRPYNPYK